MARRTETQTVSGAPPRARDRVRRALVVLLALALGLGAVAVPALVQAADQVPFAARFSANANGNVLTIGNTLMTCGPTVPNCAQMLNGTATGSAANNNDKQMVYLDQDGAAFPTRNSSRADLTIPAGSSVLFAGLYWGASTAQNPVFGTGTPANLALINQMSFRTPGMTSYATVTASPLANAQFGPFFGSRDTLAPYQRFADVTSMVQNAVASGAGNQYWGGNVEGTTGTRGGGFYAGWGLVVVYQNPNEPLRNLTVFDGFQEVDAHDPSEKSFAITGFRAPSTGPVNVNVSAIAYEGDRGTTGDYFRLNNTQLATALSPGSNFFDSAIGFNGANVTTRAPNSVNNLGFDIKNLGANGSIGNGATSATARFATSGDGYHLGMFAFAINLWAPDFTSSSKTVQNLGGNTPARAGDTLRYTVSYRNAGQGASLGSVSVDPLPAGFEFVPGSLQILSNPDGSANGAYGSGDRTLRVRLGQGATAGAGGTLSPGQSASYTYLVQLTEDAAGTTFSNVATLDYTVADIGSVAGYPATAPPITVAQQADVAITKGMTPAPAAAGGTVTSVLTVTNNGPTDATNVVVTDPVQAGLTWSGVTASNGASCTATAGSPFSCNVGTISDGDSVEVTLTATTDAASTATQLTNTATVSADQFDDELNNNAASATIQLTRRADLSIAKTPDAATITPGTTQDYTLTVSNLGPSNAQNVTITDVVPASSAGVFSIVSATGSAGVACNAVQGSSVTCSIASLPATTPATTATVTVRVALAASAAAPLTVTNTSSVASSVPDPVPGNNTSTVTAEVGPALADMQLEKVVSFPPTGSPPDVAAGTRVNYLIRATNLGPSEARTVIIDDPVPAGVTATTVSAGRGTCAIQGSPGSQSIHCEVASLAAPGPSGGAGATLVIAVGATVDPAAVPGLVTNTAQVVTTGSTDPSTSATCTLAGDPTPLDCDTASAPINVVGSADLVVTKTSSLSSVPALDDPVTYTLTVTNRGPSVAADVRVADLLPAGMAIDAGASNPAQCEGALVGQVWNCALGDLAVGQSVQLVLNAVMTEVPSSTTLDQAVAVGSGLAPDPGAAPPSCAGFTTPDPACANNRAVWTHSGTPTADLSVAKVLVEGVAADQSSTARATLQAGATATYMVTVRNAGPQTATNPQIVDTLPDGLVYVASSGLPATGSCDASAPPAVVCELGDALPAGSQYVAWITVQVSPDLDDGVLVTNAVTVDDAATDDPTSGNDAATTTNPVVARADLAVTDVEFTEMPPLPSAPAPIPGVLPDNNPADQQAEMMQALIYGMQMTISNSAAAGTATAKDVSFVVRLDGVSLGVGSDTSNNAIIIWRTGLGTATAGASAACQILDGDLHCTIENLDRPSATSSWLAPGESVSATFYIIVPPDAPPGAAGTGAVRAATVTPESSLANNEDEDALVIVEGETELTIDKRATPGSGTAGAWVAGGPFEYTIDVARASSDGLADATNVVVTDDVPTGLTITAASASQGGCEVTGQHVECELGTIAGALFAAAGEPVTIRISGTVDVSIDGGSIVSNTAEASTDTPIVEGAPGSATGPPLSDSDDAVVEEWADYQVLKTTDQPAYLAGGTVGYTLTIINAGPSDAEQAKIVDNLPPGLAFDPAGSDPSCYVSGSWGPVHVGDPAPGGRDFTGQEVTCGQESAPYALGVGGSRTVRVAATTSPTDLRVTSGPGATQPEEWETDWDAHPRTITNTASAGSWQTGGWLDPDPSNNTAVVDATLDKLVDLTLTAGVSTSTPAAGQEITYFGNSINRGPSAADHAGGWTAFPPGFEIVDWDVPFNDCVVRSESTPEGTVQTLDCRSSMLGTEGDYFEPVVSGVISVTVRIPEDQPAGLYTATAEVHTGCPAGSPDFCEAPLEPSGPQLEEETGYEYGTPESDYTNNRAEVTVYVQHVSDTDVVKTLVDPDPMIAGEDATWRLTVTNAGPSVADNTVISDLVPEGMSYVSGEIEGTGTDCLAPDNDTDNPVVRCQVGTLGVGDSASALITFRVDVDLGGASLCNEALVGSGSLDPDADDNTSLACGVPGPPLAADVGVTVVTPVPRLDPGSDVEFTAVIRNDGPEPTTDVIVTFDVPPGLAGATGVLVSAPSGSTAVAVCTGSLVCDIGALGVGEEVVYRIAGTATGSPGTTIQLAATVDHDRFDPNAANDTARAAVTLSGALSLTGGAPLVLLLAGIAALAAGTLLVLAIRLRRRV